MPIVESTIVNRTTQADERIAVVERHVDQLGKEYIINYLADIGTDLDSKLLQHASEIWDNLVESEINKFVMMLEDGVLPSPNLIVNNYATLLDILRRLVKRALRMQSFDAVEKALVLMNWIKTNYTTTQVASFLGVSNSVVTGVYSRFQDLENKMKPLIDADVSRVVDLED